MNKRQNAGENCIYSLGSCRGYPYVGISQDIRSNSSICITTQSSTCITTQSFLKIQQNLRERICTGVSFQSETFNSTGIETSAHIGFCDRHIQVSVSFTKIFLNTFIMEILLRNGFERKKLQKMANQYSYYNKNIL